MKIRKEPIFNNETGRESYVFSDDDGKTWCATLRYMRGRKPSYAAKETSLRGLTEKDAMARAKAWIAGSKLADVRMAGAV